MALSALAVASCAWTVRRLHPPICAVGLGAQSGWTVRGLDGTDDAAVLVSARVMRQVIVLRLASHRHGRFTLWLTPDNADADVRRRLRMRLAVLEAEPRENAA
jgi:toxin CptA